MRTLFGLCAAALLAAMPARADSISLTSVADTTISEGDVAHASGGGTDLIVGGLVNFPAACRGLLKFDLSSLPSSAVITSATVTVTVTKSRGGAVQDGHTLHRLTASWDETGAMWFNSGFVGWEGGEFLEDADAGAVFGDMGTYTFASTSGLLAAVQLWHSNASANAGWILISDSEAQSGTARRVATREAGSGQPTLTIGYSPPAPEPTVRIVSMELTPTNVLLRSLGTNGWLAFPEFSSNLISSNWTVVPNFSNAFVNGTNVTTFDRLEPICGPNVFLRVRNTRE